MREEDAEAQEQEEEEEDEDDDEEEEEEDDGVRLTHSRDSSLVSVASGNDLNAVLLSEPYYDDALRPATGRRKTRVASGVQRVPSV